MPAQLVDAMWAQSGQLLNLLSLTTHISKIYYEIAQMRRCQ